MPSLVHDSKNQGYSYPVVYLSENDMEQLTSFIEHTLGIHRSSYRLPDDVYQTLIITKLLILIEVETGQYKGKTLDKINLDLEKNFME